MNHDTTANSSRAVHRPGPAIALFFLSPLVAEFLLGNLPITFLPALVLLAPLYGGGALLIRESARRFGLGWPSIVLLGLAYGVFEEVFTTQSLFNPNYLGLRLLDYGYIPALGMSAWWTAFVLPLHMIWSTSVPIALMETLTPAQRRTPWLGRTGLTVTVILFAIASVILLRMELKKGFVASPLQFSLSAAVILVLIGLAFKVGRRTPIASPADRSAPAPLLVGAAAFVVGGAFLLVAHAQRFLPPFVDAACIVALLAGAAALLVGWSHRAGWNQRHRLAVAAGFLLTYAWYGFRQVPSVGHVSPRVDLIGNAIFATGALLLLARAIGRVKTE
ncbi:MAG TPA: hypothetical protein VG710_15485 [Opitutus sp.]|nr:hypothetical protein [Opitutus sp.]